MALDFDGADAASARPALTVSALNRAVAGLLERSFPLVRVRGELANLTRASSGHWYFALKDDDAQVHCVMFRSRNQLLDWAPRDGDDVELNAIVSLYEARGEFQLNVEFMRRTGQGRLFEEFLKLRDRLSAEGLFAADRKRALPKIPRRIALVTSMQAAALADVVTTLCRRAPYVGVVIYPVAVQGPGAGVSIARMLERIAWRVERDQIDLILLVRGGGSIEDLWSFNEEVVARAIVASPLPVVVGVGHESDITIADFAADLRAPTPTAAAELVAPPAAALRAALDQQKTALARALRRLLERTQQRIDHAARVVAMTRAPASMHAGRLEELRLRNGHALAGAFMRARGRADFCTQRLLSARPNARAASLQVDALLAAQRSAISARLQREQLRIENRTEALAHLDPGRTLARGFSIVRDGSGALVRDSEQVGIGQTLEIEFNRGGASTRVERLR